MSEETNDGDTSRSSPGTMEADVGFGLTPARPAGLVDDTAAEPLHKRLRLVDKADRYCWICVDDTPGKSSLLCDMCPRLFHCKCLGLASLGRVQQWICPECEKILRAECPMTRSRAMKLVGCDELCKLLKYALERARTNVNAEFLHPVDAEQVPQYKEFIVFPCDISTIEKNIDQRLYACTEAFMADVKWIQHNSTIFNGPQHSLTTNARSLVRQCKREVKDIEVCPECYKNVFANPLEADWFCQPCKDPHPLVWAKLKGYPFWPAKALREADGVVDVRFFGAHDRSWVALNQVYLLSKDCPGPVKGRKAGFDAAMRELELHIAKLREKYGQYEYAPLRTPYASTLAGSTVAAAPSASPSIAGSQQHPRRKRTHQRNSGTAADAGAAKVCSNKVAAVDGVEAVPSRSRRGTVAKAPAASPRSSRTQRLASKHHLFIKHSLNGVESGRSEADGGDESRSPTAGPVGLESLADVGDRTVASPALSVGSEAESSEGGDLDFAAAADDCERSSPSVPSVPSASRKTSLSLLRPSSGGGDCSVQASGRAGASANADAASLITEQLAGYSEKRDKCVAEEEMDCCPADGDGSREAHTGEGKAGVRKSLLRQCSQLRSSEMHVSAVNATDDDCVLSQASPSSCSTVLQRTPLSLIRPSATQPVVSENRDDREAEKLLGDAGSVPPLSGAAVDVSSALARDLPGRITTATATACDAFDTPVPSPSGWSVAACADPGAAERGMPHTERTGSSDSSGSVSGHSSSCRRRASADSAEPVSEGTAAVPVAAAVASSFASSLPEQPPPAKFRRTSTAVAPPGTADATGERLAMCTMLEKTGEEGDIRVGNVRGEEEASVGSGHSCDERHHSTTAAVPADLADSTAAEAVGNDVTTNGPADSWFENLEKTIKDVRAQLYGDGHQSFEPCDESGSEDDEDDDRRSSSQSEMSFGNAICERLHQSPPADGDTVQRPTEPMDVTTNGEAPALSSTPSVCVVNENCQHGDLVVTQKAAITLTKSSSAPGSSVFAAVSSFSATWRKETLESAQPASGLNVSANGNAQSPIPVAGLSDTFCRLPPTTTRSVLSPGCSIVTNSEPALLLPPPAKRNSVGPKAEPAASAADTSAVASARVTEEQLDELRLQLRRSVNSLKHNCGLLLEEVRKMAEQDKVRALTKAKRQADERMQNAVEETKCKQWCANCHREAQLYCCWNTSYCDYPCQQLHWTQHMQTCTQVSAQALADASVGYTDCDENEASNQGGELDESVSLLTEAITTTQPVIPSSMVRSSAVAVAAQAGSTAVMHHRQQPQQKQQSAGSSRRANGELPRSAAEPLTSADSQRSVKVQAVSSAAPGDRSLRQSSTGTSESSLKLPLSGLVGVAAPGRARTLLTHDFVSSSDSASARHQAPASVAGMAARHSSLTSETVVATSKQHAARSAAVSRRDNTITFGFPLTSRATGGSSSPSAVRSTASGPSPASSAVRSSTASGLSPALSAVRSSSTTTTTNGLSPASVAARGSSTASYPSPASIAARSSSTAVATNVTVKAEPSAETSRSPAASATKATTIPGPYFRVQTSHRPVAGQTRPQPTAVGDQSTSRGSQKSSSSGR